MVRVVRMWAVVACSGLVLGCGDAGTGDDAVSCGDGSCNGNEDCSICETDCGVCAPQCGDGTCDDDEDCSSCETDCGVCSPFCGDETCDDDEDCSSCETDCGVCSPFCGDDVCEGGEDCASCAADCGSCGVDAGTCGDSTCQSHEDAESCSTDCASSSCSGSSSACEPELGENCNNCSECGTCYFVSTTGSNSYDGLSHATAWATPAHALESIQGGDDVFLHAGESWEAYGWYVGRDASNTPGAVTGTADNRSILGAYYLDSDEQLGLRPADAKPILRGRPEHATNLGQHPSEWDLGGSYPNGEQGKCYPGTEPVPGSGDARAKFCKIVRIEGHYWTIQDLEVTNAWGTGIAAANDPERWSNIEVLRCNVHHTGEAGISLDGSDHGLIEGCEVSHAGLHWAPGSSGWCGGGGWPATVGVHGNDAVIRGNHVHDTLTEGIVMGKGADVGLAEYNYVWNTKSVGIYVNTGRNIVIQHNLVVGTTDPTYLGCAEWGGRHWYNGITVRNEPNFFPTSDNATVRYNVVIGAFAGMVLSNSVSDGTIGTEINNTQIYNNTFIDNYLAVNLNVGKSTGCAFRDLVFKNNVMYYDVDTCPTCSVQSLSYWNACSGNGFEYSNNLWAYAQPTTGPIDTTDIVWQPNDPLFTRMDGWSLLSSWDSFATVDLFPVSGSVATGVGTSSAGFDIAMVQGTDFHSVPIDVHLGSQSSGSWDVGACLAP